MRYEIKSHLFFSPKILLMVSGKSWEELVGGGGELEGQGVRRWIANLDEARVWRIYRP